MTHVYHAMCIVQIQLMLTLSYYTQSVSILTWLLYPSICIVQIQLMLTLSYYTQSVSIQIWLLYPAICIKQIQLRLTLSYNIWLPCIPQCVLYRYNSCWLSAKILSHVSLNMYHEDTTQSWARGSSISIFQYSTRAGTLFWYMRQRIMFN